jgi:hypothetical protein
MGWIIFPTVTFYDR